MPKSISRRKFMQLGATAAYALAMFEAYAGQARAQSAGLPVAQKLCFVISGGGGASIVDSFMAVRRSEVTANPDDLICYPDNFVIDGPNGLRALDLPDDHRSFLGGFGVGTPYAQSTFLNKYGNETTVMTMEGTSVNHLVAQQRSMTGFNINKGRTLMEEVAARHGQSLLLPNVNMCSGGYLEEGSDVSLPERARPEMVADARFFSLSTDGVRGMVGAPGTVPVTAQQAPVGDAMLGRARDLMARARGVRDELDGASVFGRTFQCSPLLQKLQQRRRGVTLDMEAEELITKLTLLGENDLPNILGSDFQPLSTFGLEPAPGTEDVRQAFDPVGIPAAGLGPGTRVFVDFLLAQAVLAFLLARFGLSCSVAFGPALKVDGQTLDVNPPLSFDYSHTSHVAAQSVMWSRMLDVMDKLITLLKITPCNDGSGEMMWDRSVIYVATDFGRDKLRNARGQPIDSTGQISTGHNLYNGHVIVSPTLQPGVFGGVDPGTLHTYGFDRTTGAAAPSTVMREGDVYSAVLRSLGWSGSEAFQDQIDLPCLD